MIGAKSNAKPGTDVRTFGYYSLKCGAVVSEDAPMAGRKISGSGTEFAQGDVAELVNVGNERTHRMSKLRKSISVFALVGVPFVLFLGFALTSGESARVSAERGCIPDNTDYVLYHFHVTDPMTHYTWNGVTGSVPPAIEERLADKDFIEVRGEFAGTSTGTKFVTSDGFEVDLGLTGISCALDN